MFYMNNFVEYLKQKRLSPKTRKNYQYILNSFKEYLLNSGIDDAKAISENEILTYFKLIRNKKISQVYYHKIVSSINRYLNFLEQNNLILLNPVRAHDLPRYCDNRYPSLTKVEIESILLKLKNDKPICIKGRAIIELGYSSALRPNEIYNLKISDIDFKKGLLFIEQSKNRKDRIIPVGKQALKWIKRYIQEIRPRYINKKSHNYVFINHKTGEKLTVYGIRWAIQQTLRLSGLKPIKPYSLRSTSATALFLNGMGIAHISKLLGHSVIKTTERYLRINTIELKKVLAKNHPRLSFTNKGGYKNEV